MPHELLLLSVARAWATTAERLKRDLAPSLPRPEQEEVFQLRTGRFIVQGELCTG